MRIDSSGNLLVGTNNANPTSAAVNDPGVELSNTGGVRSTVASNPAATFNRKNDNGAIALFRKDGTTLGSIGSEGGDSIYIGNGDTGLKFSGGSDIIQPFNTSTIASRDAAIDLGNNGARFKDLYLSGGAYLGGTASGNYLDDYEEGTWEPQLIGSSSNPSVTYHADTGGKYVKIGQLVYLMGTIRTTAISGGSGQLWIVNIPFANGTRTNGDNSDGIGAANCVLWNGTSNRKPTTVKSKHNDTVLYAYSGSHDQVDNILNVSDWGSTCQMSFTIVMWTN